jgi:hypothetical protein
MKRHGFRRGAAFLRRRTLAVLLMMMTGAMPLATAATCYNYGPQNFGYDLFSTNDDLVHDVLNLFNDDDDDDD